MLAILRAAAFSSLFCGPSPDELLVALREHIRTRRWFRGKARAIRGLELLDHVPLQAAPSELALVFVRVLYADAETEVYVLPLAFRAADGREALCELQIAERPRGVLADPSGSDELSQLLLQLLARPQTQGQSGQIRAQAGETLLARLASGEASLTAHVPSGEQSNTSVFYGREFMLKLFRQLEAGANPDLEITRFLWARGYRHVPEPLASLHYESPGLDATLGIVQRFVTSIGLAWDVTLEALARSFERALARQDRQFEIPMPSDDLLESAEQTPPGAVLELLGAHAGFVRRLAERSAELHLALASCDDAPAFNPEPFDDAFRRSLVQTAQERVARMFDLLTQQLPSLSDPDRRLAHVVLGCRQTLDRKLEALRAVHVQADRIRCHGDYHLGQVLCSADDFTILDFEGEPAQPIAVRRQKLSALYDVCGMLRSFHYAATVALRSERTRPPDQRPQAALASWSEAWYRWSSALFLGAYLKTVADRNPRAAFLPRTAAELRALLSLHLIDKCSYELGYELNNRPAWVAVPLTGLLSLADSR